MTEDLSFGKWLRQRRRMLDLSQQALADQATCARITLSRIEADTLKPSKELALLLLEKVGIPQNERDQWVRFARGLSGLPSQESQPYPRNNLPASLTTFIGREKEQAEIINLTRKYRLITLTGPGGVGKTRLSIKVGEQALGDYANGVWLAELASLNNPALLPLTILALFGIAVQSNTSHSEILSNFLRPKTILLILDNCEHLLEACAQLADTLLKNCPNLKILATSRESLGITGEAVYSVPSLDLPDLDQLLENFREYESVSLFEERAQLAKLDFSLTLENASSVAQICQRLDGIPLAIELAAAHVNMLSTEQIAARLNESFNLLTGGSRTALPRQQTIRTSIDWSWNLLTDSERSVLCCLSVFAGGWILESAEFVCSENGIEKNQVAELLSYLVAKSLVVANQASGRERRYHLLETIRQYADEKLGESRKKETIRTRHLKYFLKVSEEIEPGLIGPHQVDWFARTDDEVHNLRAALGWAIQTDVEAGLYIASRLWLFWIRFNILEGTHLLSEFLQKPESRAYARARAKALYVQGEILYLLQQFDAGHTCAMECLELFRVCGDQQGEADGLLLLGWVSPNVPERVKPNQQALALARSLGDTRRQARALWQLGWYDQHKLRFAYWEEAIALYRQLEDWRVLASILGAMGSFLVLDGNTESAKKYLDESSMLFHQLNTSSGKGFLLEAYFQIAMMQGDYEQARTHMQEDMTTAKATGNRMGYLWSRARLGYLALWEGNLAEARSILADVIGDFQKDKYEIGIAFTLERIANLNVLTSSPERAARLIGFADATREKINDMRWRVEQDYVDRDIAVIVAKIGNTAFEKAYEEGHEMTLDEAVALALGEN